jgi:hypothetical protein
MKSKTEKQIANEIAALKKIKPTVRVRSLFGDNHHHAIEAQIYVLEKKLRESQVIDRYAPDESNEEDENRQNVYDAAMSVVRWRGGEEPGRPVEEWKELVIK